MNTLRCGRLDEHPPHDWSRPPGWSRPRRTYHCEGTPAVVEGGHTAGEQCGCLGWDQTHTKGRGSCIYAPGLVNEDDE